jgi:hypothetical protein
VWIFPRGCGPSVGGRRIEFFDHPEEGGFKCRLVLIGVSTDEVDDLSVVVSGLLMIAARFVDHPQSIVAVVDLWEAHEEIPCGVFGFIEFAVVNHIDDRVGGGRELIGLIVDASDFTAEVALSIAMVVVGRCGDSSGSGLCQGGTFGPLILLKAAAFIFLSAAAVARIVASDLCLGHRSG